MEKIKYRHTVALIEQNNGFDPLGFVRFQADHAVGYIPADHLNIYLETGLFKLVKGSVCFSSELNNAKLKSGALKYVRECLLAAGIFQPKYVPYPEYRAVGGPNRIADGGHEEFTIDRNEFRYLGFPADGVFMLAFVQDTSDDNLILLQQRTDNQKWDFAAGGAVKYPQNEHAAIVSQMDEEMGALVTDVRKIGTTVFRHSSAEKKWVTSMRHHVFEGSMLPQSLENYSRREVLGFDIFTPDQIIELCESGDFTAANVQTMMVALYAKGLIPDYTPALKELKEVVEPYYNAYTPISSRQLAFKPD